jgi:hypothetical protein
MKKLNQITNLVDIALTLVMWPALENEIDIEYV